MNYKNVKSMKSELINPFLIFLLIIFMNLSILGLDNINLAKGINNYNLTRFSTINEKSPSIMIPKSAEQDNEKFELNQIGSIDESGSLRSTIVIGNYAYLADSDFGLRILDITDKTNPVVVGQYKDDGITFDLQIVGNYAYLTNGFEGLIIVNISDPSHPEKISDYKDGNSYFYIIAEGNRAYVSSSDNTIQIIDISSPNNPTLIGEINGTMGNRDFKVSGNFVYVPNTQDGIFIYNVTDVSNPILIKNYDYFPLFTYDIDVVDDLAYISGYDGTYSNPEFKILDVSDPANPISIDVADYGYGASRIYINGDFAYCYDNYDDNNSINIYNISDPHYIVKLGTYAFNGTFHHIFTANDYAYLSDLAIGLHIIDVTDPMNPTKIGIFEDC